MDIVHPACAAIRSRRMQTAPGRDRDRAGPRRASGRPVSPACSHDRSFPHVIRCRAKKRQSVALLLVTPCVASNARNGRISVSLDPLQDDGGLVPDLCRPTIAAPQPCLRACHEPAPVAASGSRSPHRPEPLRRLSAR
jgi:hypothetical protein